MDAHSALIVVRHGRTDWNAAGRFQGHADPDLDAVGCLQASQAATRIARLLAGTGPMSVVSSDLRRARATGQAIAARVGSALRLDSRLREIRLGTWEGLTEDEVATRFPQEWTAWKTGAVVRRGGGETRAHAAARVADAISDAIAGPGPAVVVGHGGSLQAGLDLLKDRETICLPGTAPHLANGEVLVIDPPGPLPAPRSRVLTS